MVDFTICESTRQWCRYTEFYVEHRRSMIEGYLVKDALTDVKNCMRHGRAAILTDESGETIGIGSFVLGVESEKFADQHIAVLGNSFFLEKYRNNRTFVRGLQVLAEQIRETNGDAKEVRIPTASGNAYTNGLYRKIARKTDTMDTRYGTFHVYSVPYDEFASFCDRFHR